MLNEEQVATRMANLVERFADRLTPAQRESVARYRNVGEWLLTVQMLLGALSRDNRAISAREREELREYLATFAAVTLPEQLKAALQRMTDSLATLTVVPSLSEQEMIQRVRTLPKVFGERIPDEDRWELTDAENARDWVDLTEATVALLRRHRVPVTPEERQMLWLLLDAMDLSRATLAKLTVR